MLAAGPPVGCDHTFKAPLAAQDIFKELTALGSAVTVDRVVGGHDGPRLCFFYDEFKGFQVDLTQCTLGYAGITVFAVCLLIVDSKMLYGSSDVL